MISVLFDNILKVVAWGTSILFGAILTTALILGVSIMIIMVLGG